MWEKERIDGKKLKCTAVPTIFGELVYQVKGKLESVDQPKMSNKSIITTTDSVTKTVFYKPVPQKIHCDTVQQLLIDNKTQIGIKN